MEGVGSAPGQNSGSFFPHLLISIGGITATALAIMAYHLIVKFIRIRRQRSTVSAPSQTLQFARGIEEKVLLAIPILAYSTKDCSVFRVDQSECVICLGELEDGEMVRLLPNCMHAFHVPCIGNWFLGHNTCPVCRSPIVVELKSTSGKSALRVVDHDDGVRNEEMLQRSASSSRVEYLNMPIDDQCCSSSSTRMLRESKSFTARSIKQLDRISSRVVRSFSQLSVGSRSSSNTTVNGILPY